ncbi:unnamed protein product, partial [Didymodactylos carnosus]
MDSPIYYSTILHTFILAPYYPWKVTHNKHHKNTGNIDKDEVFYPQRLITTDDELSTNKTYVIDAVNSAGVPYFGFGIGWFYYLVFGYSPRKINHFNPFHPMFQKHIVGVTSSLIGYGFMFYVMYLYAQSCGYLALICYHLIPVFIFGCYMVIITFLHHTEIDVPWYSNDEWDYVQGQLSTVDRHYGHVHSIIHSIGTHQIHHLFTKVPHYHLEEATEYFRKAFPHLVRLKHERIIPSFLKMFKIFIQQRTVGNDVRGDRMWSFAVAIYFITLNDGNLQMVALNGLVINIAVILFASIIGDWVDKTPRIGAVRKALYVQNLSVALMAGIVVFALLYKSHLEIVWKGYFLLFIQVLLIFLGVFATLASIASKVAISKDWIVAIYGHNQQKLALTNAAMRRIDLLTNVLAPLVAGGIMAFISRWASALLISSWNVISLFIELYLYTKVYKSAESILSNKIIEKKSIRMKPFTQLITSVKGFKTYYKMSTMYPGLALALLYFTVLSFDSVTN